MKPSILIVDDDPASQRRLELAAGERCTVRVRHPQDVELSELEEAHTILVDLRVDDWPERDALSAVSLQPTDGVALAILYRRLLHARLGAFPCAALAVHSAHLSDLSGGADPEVRPHAIARRENLEWAFSKVWTGGGPRDRLDQFIELADAVSGLRRQGHAFKPGVSHRGAIRGLLGITEEVWAQQALQDVEDAHAPVEEHFTVTNGMAFLRWMLHRVLPYPTFLWDERRLALRLGVEPAWLSAALSSSPQLAATLSTARYEGVLGDFLGARWWRSGVEAVLWSETGGRASRRRAIWGWLESEVGGVDALPGEDPVLVLDADLRIHGIRNRRDTVEVQPDDWPPFADAAWALRAEVAADPRLRTIAVSNEGLPPDGDYV